MATMAQDYYQTLGLSKNASADEIQKAYRKLARQYHPDLNPDDKTAQQKFKDIQHAYDVLSDAEKRKMYDQFGPDFERMGGGGSPFQGGGGQPFSFEDIFGGGRGGGGFQFDGDMGDIFGQFGGGGQRGGRSRRKSAQPSKGRDIETELTIPFNTAILGGKAAIEVSRGGGRDTISLKIPPGIESGKKMRLRGQGEPALGKGQAGDLLVTIKIASHPYFKRIGKNLELKLPVTISEAALGATLDIPTPSGTVSLKIPPGSNSGSRLRVRGQGVFSPTGGPGDLMVEIQIKTPEGLSSPETINDEAKKALATIERLYHDDPREGIIW